MLFINRHMMTVVCSIQAPQICSVICCCCTLPLISCAVAPIKPPRQLKSCILSWHLIAIVDRPPGAEQMLSSYYSYYGVSLASCAEVLSHGATDADFLLHMPLQACHGDSW